MCSPQIEYCSPPTKWKHYLFFSCICLHAHLLVIWVLCDACGGKLLRALPTWCGDSPRAWKKTGSKHTSLPSLTPTSCATRAATDMAATRRGWVQPIFKPPALYPWQKQITSWVSRTTQVLQIIYLCMWGLTSSIRYCGIWVVLPDPVSPSMMSTWCCSIADRRSSR